jgi:hypothetical protein
VTRASVTTRRESQRIGATLTANQERRCEKKPTIAS